MLDGVKHAHLIGAGGIGISAIGKFLLVKGIAVSGSDAVSSAITDDLAARGVNMNIGHAVENIPPECDLVVYTEAAGEQNVERVEATKRGIRSLGHFGFLGELSKTRRTVCVTGTNGKSTTTAMVGKIFEVCGWDPTVFVGSLVPGWELGNLRIGNGEFLVIEGDEYKKKMTALHPETTVITNIEEDHLDVYKDLDDIVSAFQQLADQSKSVIVNGDDDNSARISSGSLSCYAINYAGADIFAEDRVVAEGQQSFLVKRNVVGHDEILGRISLKVPGAFNMMNALAAISVALSYGAKFADIEKALGEFGGIWRRFERVGELVIPPAGEGTKGGGSATVISDYGHHPTAIRATLAAAKEFFPGRRLVLCFQPHQHSRTKELFADFVSSFNDADVVVLAEIYGVAGRKEAEGAVSSLDLVNAIQAKTPAGSEEVRPIEYAKELSEAEVKIREHLRPGDVVIVMGAGDIDEVARRLVS